MKLVLELLLMYGGGLVSGLLVFGPVGEWVILREIAQDDPRAVGRLVRHKMAVARGRKQRKSAPVHVMLPLGDLDAMRLGSTAEWK
jgi:hypothetical protein